MHMLPKDQQRAQISRAMPDLSPEKLEEILQYNEMKKLEDPFSLLQNDVFSQDGGQLIMFQMAPNFEMSLFIAQVSGSFLLTDSPYRWEEIRNSQSKQGGAIVYHWNDLSRLINKLEYVINANPDDNFRLRAKGNFGNIRKAFREMYSAVQDNKDVPDANLIERLKNELIVGRSRYRGGKKTA
jgi:hypothetical protein